MLDKGRLTRRDFMKGAGATGAMLWLGDLRRAQALPWSTETSSLYMASECPVHDLRARHRGVDALFRLLADRGAPLFQTSQPHPWGGLEGMIAADDVVLVKVNCQWKCRGTTNTDVVRGFIHRILQHPDGFQGEVVILENGQGQGAFDGDPNAWGSYAPWPVIDQGVWVNAEEENTLTVDHLVEAVFRDQPVSSYLLDPIRSRFITGSDHATDGYRRESTVSYPCFTSRGGNRVELKEGIWTGSGHSQNLKLFNIPVFKHHDGTGITGALKHTYGILSMADGYYARRHYSDSGAQCGQMFTRVRAPLVNIVDCIWVSPGSLSGYPPPTTFRTNTLLASIDPVALDYHAAKHILHPLGGPYASQHDPDSFPGLMSHLTAAQDHINTNGGIRGAPAHQGDDSIEVFTASAASQPFPDIQANGADGNLRVPAGTPISLRVSCTAGDLAGRPVTGWVLARTPSGWWSYAQGEWRQGLHRFYDGAARDLPGIEVWNDALPPGDYVFYTAINEAANGPVAGAWWDAVRVRSG